MFAIDRLLAILTLTAALVCAAVQAQAAGRVAFVIGNSAYDHASVLPNPRSDAEAIAAALQRLDFEVTLRTDLPKADFERELADFSERALGAEMALVYFAGHGMEMNGQNYLIPTDASLKLDLRVKFETVSLDDVLSAVEGARGLKIVLLDACRDNPFTKGMTRQLSTRSIGRGLARVETAPGVLVSYSAAAGTVAEDGGGRHSPYTEALLRHIEQAGLELNLLFRKVADEVQEKTDGRQTPYEYGRLPGTNIYLKSPPEIAKPEVITVDPCLDARVHWEAIEDRGNAGLFEDHVRRFPECAFASIARQELEILRKSRESATSTVTDDTSAAAATAEISPGTGSQPAETETTAVSSDNGPVEVATLTQEEAAAEPVPALEGGALALAQQKELDRLGCSPGRPDGKWGPRSRRAMESFNREASLTLATGEPTIAALDALTARRDRVCPLTCAATEDKVGERCVARTCPSGQRMNNRGVCYKPTVTTRATTRATRPTTGQSRATKEVVTKRQQPVQAKCRFIFECDSRNAAGRAP